MAAVAFIELSRIQGQIYESPYSSAARKRKSDERTAVAAYLESQPTRWLEGWSLLDTSDAYDREAFENTFGPVRVIYYSILALLHRGTVLSNSAKDISPSCFNAANRGLKAHLDYHPKLVSSAPCARVFCYTSFTPFVFAFLRCIANSDADSLRLLQDVLGTLEQIGQGTEYAQKQFNLCKALCRIAEALLDSRKTTKGPETGRSKKHTLCLPLQSPFATNSGLPFL